MTINNQFIEENAYVVRTIVKQYHYLNIEEDLMQEGYMGLIEAGRKYDPECGVKFESYAAWWVRKYVKEAVRIYGHIVTMPKRKKEDDIIPIGVSYDMPLYDEDGDVITLADTLADTSNLEELIKRDQVVEKVMECLSEQEKQIVKYHFGIEGEQKDANAIAQIMGIKRKDVYNKYVRAVKKMQKNAMPVSNLA